MTISTKHKFVSSKSDSGDASLVQPSNWNDEHDITLAAGKVLGRDTSGAGLVQELPIAVDSSGNVGIGTGVPGKTLDVVGQTRVGASTSNGYALLEYGRSATGTNNWHVGSEGDGTFRWYNGNLGAGSERMRIDSAGNVGIGLTNPSSYSPFTVAKGTAYVNQNLASIGDSSMGRYLRIHNVASGGNTRTALSAQYDGSDTNYFDLLLNPNSGNVGIGTSSPAGKAHVALSTSFSWGDVWTSGTAVFGGATNSSGALGISYNDTSGGVIGAIAPGVAWKNISIYTNDFTVSTGSSLERMRITSTGNVGIGTSSPTEKLSVVGKVIASTTEADATAKQGFFGVKHYTNAEEPFLGVHHYVSSGTNTLYLGGGSGSGNAATLISFYTAANTTTVTGTERMRIDSAGNLSFNSGYGSAATAYGCRAWVNFNGTGTVAIKASGNVSSITDLGTGYYAVNFSTALVDTNYSVAGFGVCYSSANLTGASQVAFTGPNNGTYTPSSKATTTFRLSVGNPSTGTAVDSADISVSVFR